MVVVAGIDDSPLAVPVLVRAVEAAQLRKTGLHAVHVFHRPTVVDGGFGGIYPVDMTKLASAESEHVWSRVDAAIEDATIPISKIDLEGYPPDTLVEHVKEVGAQLLVIGTRGRGELASLILGSTSHRALHLAPCDVLVVKPDRGSDA